MAHWRLGGLLLLLAFWGARLEQETLEPGEAPWGGGGNASGLLRRRLPQSIIIGVRKGGTRALLEMLTLHPQVAAARAEVHFFNVEEHYSRGLGWYRQRMPLSRPGQLTVEKTPAYFSCPRAPGRIRAMDPAVRLLLIVRDPVERLVSDYTQILHRRRARRKPYPPLERLLLAGGRRLDTRHKALQRSLYARHLARWLAAFPRAQLHVVDGGGLTRRPLAELRPVERFLGLPPRLGPANFYYNRTKGFYCLRAGAGAPGRCLDESKGRPHPPLAQRLREQLCAYFFRLAGRVFNWC
ncbi:heparan sulfate glucosamine 3-O-sulfotransferase 1-like [Emydura macquarii macquarii]|uniref:heparan sulfate glucosamine 3-O-sulfotransferase 1-like n=1 Tax=Emydura macquarii macquarii TaxID=1129001 RepID=UPI00352A066A